MIRLNNRDIKMISVFLLFFLLFVICVFQFIPNDNNDEHICDKDYLSIDNYFFNQNDNYEFLFDKSNYKYLVIGDSCDIIFNDESKDIFKNYFISRFVLIINQSPRQINDISEISDFIVSLLDKPFENIENKELKVHLDNLKNQFQIFSSIVKINKITEEYQYLLGRNNIKIDDLKLDQFEIIETEDNIVEFIYVFLDETGLLYDFINDSWFSLLYNPYLMKFDFYSNMIKNISMYAIKKAFFETPINLVYELSKP